MKVTTVVNGKEALETFENAPAGFFDLTLMDVQMPEMNGMNAHIPKPIDVEKLLQIFQKYTISI